MRTNRKFSVAPLGENSSCFVVPQTCQLGTQASAGPRLHSSSAFTNNKKNCPGLIQSFGRLVCWTDAANGPRNAIPEVYSRSSLHQLRSRRERRGKNRPWFVQIRILVAVVTDGQKAGANMGIFGRYEEAQSIRAGKQCARFLIYMYNVA